MTTLHALRKNSSVEKLSKLLQDSTSNKNDPTYWKLEVDKAGNGFAIIRFLDAPFTDGEEAVPFVQYWSHSFKGPGGWYIEYDLNTIGLDDPVGEYNSKLWATGIEANKDIARKQKRQLNFVSNIKVISDPQHPENNGKVFRFRYGKKIQEMIQEKTKFTVDAAGNRVDNDEVIFNAFNFWEGANFKIKARKGDGGFQSYDKSEFAAPSPVADTDEEIDAIWKSEYSLKEVIDKSKFKTYEQLKARLDKVLGAAPQGSSVETAAVDDLPADEAVTVEEGDASALDLFRKLANS